MSAKIALVWTLVELSCIVLEPTEGVAVVDTGEVAAEVAATVDCVLLPPLAALGHKSCVPSPLIKAATMFPWATPCPLHAFTT